MKWPSQMRVQYYDGTWSDWFLLDECGELKGLYLAVEIVEKMTKEEYFEFQKRRTSKID